MNGTNSYHEKSYIAELHGVERDLAATLFALSDTRHLQFEVKTVVCNSKMKKTHGKYAFGCEDIQEALTCLDAAQIAVPCH